MTELATLPNELLSYEMLRQSFSQEDVAAKLREIPAEKWELHGKEPWEFVKDASAKTVRRWEQGIVKSLSPYYLRRLVKLFERPAQELGYPEKGIPFWHVPHNQPSQSNFFMNRDNYILKLHSVIELRNQQYKSDKNTDRTQVPLRIWQQILPIFPL